MTTLDSLPDPMQPKEVAELLRVSVSTVYALIARGELKALRLGAGKKRPMVVVRKKDYLSWFEQEEK